MHDRIRWHRVLLVFLAGAAVGGACAPHVDRDGDGFRTEEADCDD